MVEYIRSWFCLGPPTYQCLLADIPAPGGYATKEECCASCNDCKGHPCDPGDIYIRGWCLSNYVVYGAGIGLLYIAYKLKTRKK